MKYFIPYALGTTHVVTSADGGHLCIATGLPPQKRLLDDVRIKVKQPRKIKVKVPRRRRRSNP